MTAEYVAIPPGERQFPLFVRCCALANKFARTISASLLTFHKILDSLPSYVSNRNWTNIFGIGLLSFHPNVACPHKVSMHESSCFRSLNGTTEAFQLLLVYLQVRGLTWGLHTLHQAMSWFRVMLSILKNVQLAMQFSTWVNNDFSYRGSHWNPLALMTTST